jgi:hypothetical protein
VLDASACDDLNDRFDAGHSISSSRASSKKGKSSLINALLGAPALSVSVIPLTSVVTQVQYGDTAGARIEFEQSDPVRVPIAEIAQYVTESGNPATSSAFRNNCKTLPRRLSLISRKR